MFLSDRLLSVWRRAVALGWPIAVQQALNTLMRTVDIVVTGLLSPAAVAAVGIADLYAQVLLRIGQGLGASAIALSSQDTGRGAGLTRDRAVTQALLIGALCGIPLIVVGQLFSHALMAILGAESAVVRLGGLYLTIIFAAAPMRIVGLVGAQALQGTGDTRTPMLVNGSANVLNILLTVTLGLGLGAAPSLGIVGVGVATAVSRTFEALAIVGAIASARTPLSLARPRSLTITRQLIAVGAPTFAEGISSSTAKFPFNALLLLFGTEANAAYHIGRRLYQQLTGPLYRSSRTVTSIVVGQALGGGDPEEAHYATRAILALGVVTLSCAGAVLFVSAERLVTVFTRDPTTVGYAVTFTRTFALTMPFYGAAFPLTGALRGAGDTRTPFYTLLVSSFVFMLGVSYLLGVTLGYGLFGVYVGLFLFGVSRATGVGAGFLWGDWRETAATMIAEREQADEARH